MSMGLVFADPIGDMLERILPNNGDAAKFAYNVTGGDTQQFTLSCDGSKITVNGSDYIAVATGINWYLQHYAGVDISWNSPTGTLPASLPACEAETHKASVDWRYYLNFCTYSYSMSFWDWNRWQQELDWMALHGVNMPLAITGMECVWREVLSSTYGYTLDEVNTFVCGSAYYGWFFMNNITAWGGPQPESWYKQQEALGRKIFQRMKDFGMSPVIPGYVGMIPKDFLSQAEASTIAGWQASDIVNGGTWCSFTRPYFVNDTARLKEFAANYYAAFDKLFGDVCSTHFYAIDPFHEGGVPQGVTNASASVQAMWDALTTYDKDAVWVAQHWQENPTTIVTHTIPARRLIILDLHGDQYADTSCSGQHTTSDGNNHDWVWGQVSNFGGNVGLFGRMDRLIDCFYKARDAKATNKLVGIGAIPEGIENNAMLYDLMFALPWTNTDYTRSSWLADYVRMRYGLRPDDEAYATVLSAWTRIGAGIYNCPNNNQQGTTESVFLMRPALVPGRVSSWAASTWYWDFAELRTALHEMLSVQDVLADNANYRYDLVDIARQVLADYGKELLDKINAEGSQADKDRFLALILDQDRLLGTRSELRLGRWTEAARTLGNSDAEKDLYEKNARMLLTTWGDHAQCEQGGLHDYANREWNGLLSSYYYPRWKSFFQHGDTAQAWFNDYEWPFANGNNGTIGTFLPDGAPFAYGTFSDKATGDELATVRELYDKYFANDTSSPQLRADNIDEVLQAMTLEEKAQLLVGGASGFKTDGAVVGSQAKQVPGAAGSTAAIARLGIPATILTDGPAGVRIDAHRSGTDQTYFCTGFPIGTCLAATWNRELVEQVGAAIGNETKEYGCDVILGPGMNLHRNPLCGRNFEYYSEDPLLTGRIAASYIKGVQAQGAGVSIKHFAVNSQETARTSVDERLSARAARELYLRGFEIAVRESDPWTVMSSYNRINGKYSMGNHDLLTKVLRDDWGYRGIVMSDWIGVRGDLQTTDEVHAGNDLLEPGQRQQVEQIIEGVKQGRLSIEDVDRNVRRMLQYIVKTPAFNSYAFTNHPDLEAHALLTRQAANEGIVLLKNNGVLPINCKTVSLYGASSYRFLSGGTGSGCVHTPYVVDMLQGLQNAGISTTTQLTDIYRKYDAFAHAKYQVELHPSRWAMREEFGDQKYEEFCPNRILVASEARKADAAIITIARQAGEGEDRNLDTEFNLTPVEHQMITLVCEQFHAVGKPVIVVINSGSVVETASWSDLPDAIVCAWQPGEEGGNSVADVLTGKVCPSGRLTMTWPIRAADHPSTRNFPGYPDLPGGYTNHDEDIYVGYRYFDSFDRPVAYPFGFGLSYTTFDYTKPSIRVNGDFITVSVTVRNTGSVAGKEVVQVYVAAPSESMEKPVQELKAFAKTRQLQPAESQTVTMEIPIRDLASYDEQNSRWLTEAGTYAFRIGASSRDIRHTVTARIREYVEPTSTALQPRHRLNLLKRH